MHGRYKHQSQGTATYRPQCPEGLRCLPEPALKHLPAKVSCQTLHSSLVAIQPSGPPPQDVAQGVTALQPPEPAAGSGTGHARHHDSAL